MSAFVLGFITGMLSLLGYMITRMLSSDGWDSSNITNALRLISHTVMHPEDFGKMWYIDKNDEPDFRPFGYIDKDELSEVVKTRPRSG